MSDINIDMVEQRLILKMRNELGSIDDQNPVFDRRMGAEADVFDVNKAEFQTHFFIPFDGGLFARASLAMPSHH
jgi:hypothetical protein